VDGAGGGELGFDPGFEAEQLRPRWSDRSAYY
jgi:hypothetical protein